MNKKGFTLAEVLITLGVIGVLSTMVIPILGNITPNKEKMKVLKANKVLNDITQDFLHDPSLYFNGDNDEREEGLAEHNIPINPKFNDNTYYYDQNKYCNLLANHMNTVTKTLATSGRATWITSDFMKWTCESESIKFDQPIATIYVDINEDGGNNCTYSSSCKKPDTFSFIVWNLGKIEGGDELTKVYLKNNEQLNNKSADYNEAKSNL